MDEGDGMEALKIWAVSGMYGEGGGWKQVFGRGGNRRITKFLNCSIMDYVDAMIFNDDRESTPFSYVWG